MELPADDYDNDQLLMMVRDLRAALAQAQRELATAEEQLVDMETLCSQRAVERNEAQDELATVRAELDDAKSALMLCRCADEVRCGLRAERNEALDQCAELHQQIDAMRKEREQAPVFWRKLRWPLDLLDLFPDEAAEHPDWYERVRILRIPSEGGEG